MESKKLYYTMGEVCEMFDVPPSTIRHWENYFSTIKATRNKKGNRLFDNKSLESLRLIYHLVKERGMTLEGAKKSLKGNKGEINRHAELLERLMSIRSMLVEVREELKGGDFVESDYSDAAVTLVEKQMERVAKVASQTPQNEQDPAEESVNLSQIEEQIEDSLTELSATDEQESLFEHIEQPQMELCDSEEEAEECVDEQDDDPTQPKPRKPRKPKKTDEEKGLFAYYEQTLF